MRRMCLYLEKRRDMYILEGKGKEKGKRGRPGENCL